MGDDVEMGGIDSLRHGLHAAARRAVTGAAGPKKGSRNPQRDNDP